MSKIAFYFCSTLTLNQVIAVLITKIGKSRQIFTSANFNKFSLWQILVNLIFSLCVVINTHFSGSEQRVDDSPQKKKQSDGFVKVSPFRLQIVFNDIFLIFINFFLFILNNGDCAQHICTYIHMYKLPGEVVLQQFFVLIRHWQPEFNSNRLSFLGIEVTRTMRF